MGEVIINNSATFKNSTYSDGIKIFRNVIVNNSSFGRTCSIGDDSVVERCTVGNNVVINRRCYINDSHIGDFTYMGINSTMNWTSIGKFCSLARNVDIGGFDHDYKKVTTLPMFRFKQQLAGGGKLDKLEEHDRCSIGNDVWIAAGAQVLHKALIGDGAIVGAGAVVTHDVPPYAIVAGVPARIIGFRFSAEVIERLLKIRWWDWPEAVILENLEWFINSNVTPEVLNRMEEIGRNIF